MMQRDDALIVRLTSRTSPRAAIASVLDSAGREYRKGQDHRIEIKFGNDRIGAGI